MLVGYARTSTVDQKAGLEAQLAELKVTGCEELFVEQVSSVQRREELEKALNFIRKGDTLVITKLDRLARSIPDLVRIIEHPGGEASHPSYPRDEPRHQHTDWEAAAQSRGSVAQFEREIMLERQREGVAKAKAEGKYKGRKPTARAKGQEVIAKFKADQRPAEIAKSLGIGRASVYRILSHSGLVGEFP